MERRVPAQPSERVGWPAESLARAADAIGERMDGAAVHDVLLLAKAALYAAAPTTRELRELVAINRLSLERVKHSAVSSDTVWPDVEAVADAVPSSPHPSEEQSQ